jgi:CHAD domain-containing protein
VRDADVRCELLLQPQIVEAPSRRARQARTLRVERSRARRRLRAMLRSPATARRLRAIGEALGGESFQIAGVDTQALLLRSTRRRCRKLARSLERGRTGNVARRHQLRIRVKKCRYLLDACGVEPDSGRNRRTLARLHDLQDCLGDLNDVAQTRRWLKQQEAQSDDTALSREMLRARKRRLLARLARLRAKLHPREVVDLLE